MNTSFAPLAFATESLETILANIGYTARRAEKLYFYRYPPPEGVAESNVTIDPRETRIANARPVAEEFSLDREGFALVRHRSAVRDFGDEAQTLALGHPEAAEIVKAATGAARVVVFDHTVRRRTGKSDLSVQRQPVARAHVDQTVASGPQRVRDIMGDQAENLLTRRAAVINVWRPIGRVARDWPLALGDGRSVDPGDLMPTDLIFQHRRGETYSLAWNPAQRWYYVPDLGVDECLLLKCWDFGRDGHPFRAAYRFRGPDDAQGNAAARQHRIPHSRFLRLNRVKPRPTAARPSGRSRPAPGFLRAISISSDCVFGLENTTFAPDARALACTGFSVDVVSTAVGTLFNSQPRAQLVDEAVAVDQRHVEIDHDHIRYPAGQVGARDGAQRIHAIDLMGHAQCHVMFRRRNVQRALEQISIIKVILDNQDFTEVFSLCHAMPSNNSHESIPEGARRVKQG